MSPKEMLQTEVELTGDTPVRLPIEKLWALIVAIVSLFIGAWVFHSSAVAAINGKIEVTAKDLRAERSVYLQPYLPREEYQKDRELDYRYWDDRLDKLKDDLVAEIRKTK